MTGSPLSAAWGPMDMMEEYLLLNCSYYQSTNNSEISKNRRKFVLSKVAPTQEAAETLVRTA